MTKKLKLNPKVSYILGLYECNKGRAVGVVTTSDEIVARFVKTAMDEFDIAPNKILIEGDEEEDGKETKVYFYHSKLRKLFENALERRERLFKYKNAYSANYFAGIFDMKGGRDPKGVFLRDLEERDGQLLENIGFHTTARGSKTYIMNENTFIGFIKEFSVKA
jgi:hypothetical protein